MEELEIACRDFSAISHSLALSVCFAASFPEGKPTRNR